MPNASATLPTITKYGVTPSYGYVTSIVPWRFFLTYTDADNQSPEAGYPKAFRYTGVAWPAFAFVANDSEDVNYADGKAYYYDYYNFPLIGVTMFKFEVKSNGEAIVWKWPITITAHPQSSPVPYHIFPVGNDIGLKVFTFNYTSVWGYSPYGVNVTVDETSHSMIANDTGDIEYRDGKDFYFEMYINTSGLHNYSFQWTETSYAFDGFDTGIYWILLEEPTDYNQIGLSVAICGMLLVIPVILFWTPKRNKP